MDGTLLMDADGRPCLGFLQSQLGREVSVGYSEMKRNSKSELPPSVIRGIVAQNVSQLRDHRLAHLPNVTARNRELARKCWPTSLSQVQRIIAQDLGTSVDHIERLAAALEVRPQDLLTPYFANSIRPAQNSSKETKDDLHRDSSGRHPLPP